MDDAFVGIALEVVEEGRVEAGESDEHEPGVRMCVPDRLGRIEELDIALVALFPSDVEDDRRVSRDPVTPAESGGVPAERGVRSHARRHDAVGVDPV